MQKQSTPTLGLNKMEKCTKCTKLKPVKEFYLSKQNKNGIRPWCKECSKEYSQQWRTKNPKKYKESRFQWKLKNKREISESGKKYRIKNKEHIKKYRHQWVAKNPDYSQRWVEKNKDRCVSYDRKRNNTVKGSLNGRLRSAIRHSIAKETKNKRKWETLVGFTVDKLKRHLEKQFREGMSWEKFLNGEIQIDHIIPVSKFNFTSPDHFDFKRCWALKNLQPMWAKENLSKGAKIDKHFQPSLKLQSKYPVLLADDVSAEIVEVEKTNNRGNN